MQQSATNGSESPEEAGHGHMTILTRDTLLCTSPRFAYQHFLCGIHTPPRDRTQSSQMPQLIAAHWEERRRSISCNGIYTCMCILFTTAIPAFLYTKSFFYIWLPRAAYRKSVLKKDTTRIVQKTHTPRRYRNCHNTLCLYFVVALSTSYCTV